MKIAAAQIKVEIGEIGINLEVHKKFVNKAIKENVSIISFPEMSITGYCREEGRDLAFKRNDKRLEELKIISINNEITVIVGAPIIIEEKLYIGSFILKPDGSEEIYTKQYLHSGEEIYYNSSFKYNPKVEIEKERIALAICADTSNEGHLREAKNDNATLYLPSIFFSEKGMENGAEMFEEYAKKYSLPILVSNFYDKHWNMTSGGKSAFWNEKGEKVKELNTNEAGLLIIEKEQKQWNVRKVIM